MTENSRMAENYGRVIGVDLGDSRVGIALSNPDRTLASPLEVLKRTGNLHRDIAKIVDEWEATVVVVGLPLSLDGSMGPAAKKAVKEVTRMGATLRVPIETYDERLTTVTAERLMTDAGLDSRNQRKVVDKIAAAIMLQAWLDRQAHIYREHD
ncbi:MAG: Holliday junction resolvase RuvX [Acidimicrobiaceae bacterium]|jgi:putative holliday junction resolvase|nr:Holliday junction resolvase RuvX [Acidimicrobiaceae bacterium]MCH9802738.1 Holliday junction resolvase RuvX [bacterium]MDB4102563.1 Holliday junction resolvase RuvX [Acidimicrobiales bacterium]MCO4833430.1 Holliday junction resolvase RuvX [Acidimicrobiaceae bacterium]MDB4818565.1 Holliday junction resolvase RuvX [Acidimicrobiales bacterium]